MARRLPLAKEFKSARESRDFGLRHENLHELHRVETMARKHRTLCPDCLTIEITKVGKQVVGHEHRTGLKFPKVVEHSFYVGCVHKHVFSYTGIACDELGDTTRYPNKGLEATGDLTAADTLSANL
jgi:hypothetical protein